MPRPVLSLYRQIPIAYKHRCLLLDATLGTESEIQEITLKIKAGFTGIVVTAAQLESLSGLQQIKIPKVVVIQPGIAQDISSLISDVQDLGASAVLLGLELGHAHTNQELSQIKKIISKARSAKLATIIKINANSKLIPRVRTVLLAYMLQLSADYNASYLLTNLPISLQDLSLVQQIVASGKLLLPISMSEAKDIRRLMAGGADGAIVELSEILTENDPGQTAYDLGESVFGPGSYQP